MMDIGSTFPSGGRQISNLDDLNRRRPKDGSLSLLVERLFSSVVPSFNSNWKPGKGQSS